MEDWTQGLWTELQGLTMLCPGWVKLVILLPQPAKLLGFQVCATGTINFLYIEVFYDLLIIKIVVKSLCLFKKYIISNYIKHFSSKFPWFKYWSNEASIITDIYLPCHKCKSTANYYFLDMWQAHTFPLLSMVFKEAVYRHLTIIRSEVQPMSAIVKFWKMLGLTLPKLRHRVKQDHI